MRDVIIYQNHTHTKKKIFEEVWVTSFCFFTVDIEKCMKQKLFYTKTSVALAALLLWGYGKVSIFSIISGVIFQLLKKCLTKFVKFCLSLQLQRKVITIIFQLLDITCGGFPYRRTRHMPRAPNLQGALGGKFLINFYK